LLLQDEFERYLVPALLPYIGDGAESDLTMQVHHLASLYLSEEQLKAAAVAKQKAEAETKIFEQEKRAKDVEQQRIANAQALKDKQAASAAAEREAQLKHDEAQAPQRRAHESHRKRELVTIEAEKQKLAREREAEERRQRTARDAEQRQQSNVVKRISMHRMHREISLPINSVKRLGIVRSRRKERKHTERCRQKRNMSAIVRGGNKRASSNSSMLSNPVFMALRTPFVRTMRLHANSVQSSLLETSHEDRISHSAHL